MSEPILTDEIVKSQIAFNHIKKSLQKLTQACLSAQLSEELDMALGDLAHCLKNEEKGARILQLKVDAILRCYLILEDDLKAVKNDSVSKEQALRIQEIEAALKEVHECIGDVFPL